MNTRNRSDGVTFNRQEPDVSETEGETNHPSDSDEDNSGIEILYEGSAILECMATTDALSVELSRGSLQTIVDAQAIVSRMSEMGFNGVEYVRMVKDVEVLDTAATERPEPIEDGRTSASVAAIAISSVMVLGIFSAMDIDVGLIASNTNMQSAGRAPLPV